MGTKASTISYRGMRYVPYSPKKKKSLVKLITKTKSHILAFALVYGYDFAVIKSLSQHDRACLQSTARPEPRTNIRNSLQYKLL